MLVPSLDELTSRYSNGIISYDQFIDGLVRYGYKKSLYSAMRYASTITVTMAYTGGSNASAADQLEASINVDIDANSMELIPFPWR